MSDTAKLLDFSALAAFRGELSRFAGESRELLERIGAQLRQFRDVVEQRGDACRRDVQSAQYGLDAAISACRQDERACGAVAPAQARYEGAVAEMNRVEGLVRTLDDAVQRHYGPMQRYAGALSNVPRVLAVLDQVGRASTDYRAVALPAAQVTGGVSRPSLGMPSGVPAAGGPEPIGSTGMVVVPLSAIDTTQSTVAGPASFQKVSYPEMQRGLNVLDEVVLPSVRAGADGDYFSRLDEARGVPYGQGTRRVYDAFFGDSAVLLNRVGNRYTVTNGQHRIFLARELGMTSLPARVLN